MQYKLYRYTEALYPRPYLPNCQYDFPEFGYGKVLSTVPTRDTVTHEKFWITKVFFRTPNGSEFDHSFHFPANDSAIQMFYKSAVAKFPTEEDFSVAEFDPNFSTDLTRYKSSVHNAITKVSFTAEEKKRLG